MENSKLQEEINRIPYTQRFFTGKGLNLLGYYCDYACVFGYGNYPNTEPLNTIPPNTNGLFFYYGSDIKELLKEILALPIKDNLEYLTIGITHNNAKYYDDYSEITKILSKTQFPRLKFFEYGVDELIANEGRIYGNLGNISDVLNNMPLLEKLYLHGNFSLAQPLILPLLTDLETHMNDFVVNINGGKISNATLQYLLSSNFDALRLLSLNLGFNDNQYDYTIPDTFLTGQYTPQLKILELEGKFKSGTKLQISNSIFLGGNTQVHIEDLKEPIV